MSIDRNSPKPNGAAENRFQTKTQNAPNTHGHKNKQTNKQTFNTQAVDTDVNAHTFAVYPRLGARPAERRDKNSHEFLHMHPRQCQNTKYTCNNGHVCDVGQNETEQNKCACAHQSCHDRAADAGAAAETRLRHPPPRPKPSKTAPTREHAHINSIQKHNKQIHHHTPAEPSSPPSRTRQYTCPCRVTRVRSSLLARGMRTRRTRCLGRRGRPPQ